MGLHPAFEPLELWQILTVQPAWQNPSALQKYYVSILGPLFNLPTSLAWNQTTKSVCTLRPVGGWMRHNMPNVNSLKSSTTSQPGLLFPICSATTLEWSTFNIAQHGGWEKPVSPLKIASQYRREKKATSNSLGQSNPGWHNELLLFRLVHRIVSFAFVLPCWDIFLSVERRWTMTEEKWFLAQHRLT